MARWLGSPKDAEKVQNFVPRFRGFAKLTTESKGWTGPLVTDVVRMVGLKGGSLTERLGYLKIRTNPITHSVHVGQVYLPT